MTLNKRYIRNIKQNLSFYICVMLLTTVAIILYVACSGASRGEGDYLDKFFAENHVEDAQFATYQSIDKDAQRALSEKYNVTIEEQSYADFDVDDPDCDARLGSDIAEEYTIRVFAPTEKIDTYEVLDGTDVQADDEILLTPRMMALRGFEIGDTIELGGKRYTIVGSMARPDYLSPYINNSDNMFQFDAFGCAIVSTRAYEEIEQAKKNTYYSVIYGESTDEKAFRKAVHADYYILSYIAATSNMRIRTARNEIKTLDMYTGMILPVMVLFIVLLIAIVLGRKIKSEAKQIGVLSALGYGKGRLALHYGIFGLIPGVGGALLGILSAIPLRDAMIEMIFGNKIEKLPVDYSSSAQQMLYACLIPVVAYVLVAMLAALRVLRLKTVELLHGNGGVKRYNRMRMAKSKLKFTTKFKLRALIGNWSRSLVVIFGVAVGGILMIFCYVCVDSLENFCDKSVHEVGSYEYEYFLTDIRTEPVTDATPIMIGNFGVEGSETNMVYMGMDNNPYMELKNTQGEELTMTKGKHYISAMASMLYNVKKGGTLQFYNLATMEEYTVTIDDVIQNDCQSILYGNWADACAFMDVPEGSYNALMSDKKLDLEESEYLSCLSKQALSDQINEITFSMKQLINISLVFAGVIIVISIYLMVNMLINENASSISMLKVLGYEDKEINQMMLHIYHILIPIGFVLSAVGGVALCRMNFEASVSTYNTYIETVYKPHGFIIFAVLLVASYVVSLLLLGRKVKRADMIESLKDNRE